MSESISASKYKKHDIAELRDKDMTDRRSYAGKLGSCKLPKGVKKTFNIALHFARFAFL